MGARTTPRKRVTGIGGVFLRSRNPKKLARWYRDHLGIAADSQVVTFEWISPRRGHKVGATLWAALADGDRDWGRGHPTAMVNYRVDNLHRLLAQLTAEGVAVEPRTEDSAYGRFGWVTDPDGNRLELWEPPTRRYRSPDRHVPMA